MAAPDIGQVQSAHPFPAYAGQTYYGIPPLKHSHYGLKTATGFFLQGIGSSAQMIATIGDLLDRETNRKLIRMGRMLSFLASPAGPLMFVAALHTPKRWYNMLRIFKPTSPMSIGIWTLTKMSGFNTVALAGNLLADEGMGNIGKWLDRLSGILAAAAGGLVSVYMGTEIEETSMPIWIGAFPFVSPLVAATSFSNGVAALSLAASFNGDSEGTLRRLRRIGGFSSASQTALACLMSRGLRRSVGRSPIRRRTMAAIWSGLLAPAALRALDMRSGRASSIRVDIAALAGGAAIMAALVLAGRKSGNIPQDYFELTSAPALPEPAPGDRSIRDGRRRASKKALWGVAVAAGLIACFAGSRRLST
ncbi:MAG: NrfD/PsrC family molybdoenzyme membrane anchor subunit [Thermodesulfobacteriota bacterium]